jgi:hypothetical protein
MRMVIGCMCRYPLTHILEIQCEGGEASDNISSAGEDVKGTAEDEGNGSDEGDKETIELDL